MQLAGKAPNWQRLNDGIKAICRSPDMDLTLECRESERILAVSSGSAMIEVPYQEIADCLFWTMAIRLVGYRMLEAIQKCGVRHGNLSMIPGICFEPRIGTPERAEWQDAENRRVRARLDLAIRRKAPWPDCRGADIYEGDTIVHPQGDCGTVLFDASREPGLEWRVKYLSGEESLWLGNQIGDKGQACVLTAKNPHDANLDVVNRCWSEANG